MTDVLADFGTETGAFDVAIYIIISMIILVGMVQLLARIMRNRRLEEWARDEFIQAIISAAIVGGLFVLMNPGTGVITTAFTTLVPADSVSIVSTMTGVMGTVSANGCSDADGAGLADGSVLCYAYNYLSLLRLQIGAMSAFLFVNIAILDVLAKYSIDMIILEITPLAGLSALVDVYKSMLSSLTFLGIILGIEQALLIFINNTALNIFLPVGVVLRCFFATRRLGGALIALSVGLYLVFPLLISLNAISVEQTAASAFEPFIELQNHVDTLNIISGGHFESPEDYADSEKWMAYLGTYQDIIEDMGTLIEDIPDHLYSIMAALLVQVILLPILSVMLTIIAIREMANVFGSEVSLSRFEV